MTRFSLHSQLLSTVVGQVERAEDIGEKVEDTGDIVGVIASDKVPVDERVQVAMDGACGVSGQLFIYFDSCFHWQTLGRQVWRFRKENLLSN